MAFERRKSLLDEEFDLEAAVRDVLSDVIGARRVRCHLLTDLLGDDHDLVVLRQVIDDERDFLEERVGQAPLERLVSAMSVRSTQLRREAYYVGAALFTEEDDALVARFGGYWTCWRK